jgi:hypothetical protein
MCKSYDTRYIGKCSDERADTVTIKDSANFCEWFEPRSGAFASAESDAARSAETDLRALFGEEAPGDPPDNSGGDSGGESGDNSGDDTGDDPAS